jgi:hypothetical protein
MESIREESEDDIARLAQLLAQFGAARIGDIAQLLHSQLVVIESLRSKVVAGELESEIHKIVAANIWLLQEGLTYWFDNRTFATQLAEKLADDFQFEAAQRPDLVCYDDSKLKEGKAQKLLVVEFKRPGIKIGLSELAQVMSYKSTFKASLAQFDEDDIEVVILGDTFDHRFDRSGLGPGYKIISYVELLAEAKGRYQDLYDRLVPEGMPVPGATPLPPEDGQPDEDELIEPLEAQRPRRRRGRSTTSGSRKAK